MTFGVTVTVAGAESTDPPTFVTPHQYPVVTSGVTSSAGDVAPATGVSAPWYHWYSSGGEPIAWTARVAVSPAVIVVPAGCATIRGATVAIVGSSVTVRSPSRRLRVPSGAVTVSAT